MDITFHCNLTQPHQKEHGLWFAEGFKCHGLKLLITNDINIDSDIHIVSGPHYAKQRWINHPRTILIDRAYYRQHRSGKWISEDCLSVGWMNSKGGRDFKTGHGRDLPAIEGSAGDKTIFLADYNGQVEDADLIRYHPENKKHNTTLEHDLKQCYRATGYKTSALVVAGLMGLHVECKDETNIMSQDNWLELLPYADWHYDEISNGELWEHLQL